MNDATKKIGEELAAAIAEKFNSDEIKKLVEDTKAAPDSSAGTFEVVITTENLDRYNEVIKLDGWELDHFRSNPIVLWGHDHNTPIGVATSVEAIDGKLVARGKFAPTDKAQEVRQLYDAGIIRATSVGFIEKEREGNLITKAELLEFSFVSVPANPYALSLSMERGLSVNDLVTKGFLVIEKKDAESTVPESEGEGATPAPSSSTAENGKEQQERSFSTKQIAPVVESLKSAIVALEALGSDTEEPEGDDDADIQEDDEKRYAAFSAKRKLIQDAATVLGDVLAEARQAIRKR